VGSPEEYFLPIYTARLADRSILTQNVSSVITYPSLNYSSKVFFQNKALLEKIISSFILLLSNIRRVFTGIDSTGFKRTHVSQYIQISKT
jgi:hypothetical protein